MTYMDDIKKLIRSRGIGTLRTSNMRRQQQCTIRISHFVGKLLCACEPFSASNLQSESDDTSQA